MATRQGRSLIAILVFVGLSRVGWASSSASCAAMSDVPPQIRTSSCQVAEAVATGMARSATFRRLVDRIGECKGIVYVDGKYIVQRETKRVLYATLQHRIVKAGDFRLLYVTVAPGRENTHVALLAHELQHAIEVLESQETTDAGLSRLFERVGTKVAAWTFETEAAERVQQDVVKEMTASRR